MPVKIKFPLLITNTNQLNAIAIYNKFFLRRNQNKGLRMFIGKGVSKCALNIPLQQNLLSISIKLWRKFIYEIVTISWAHMYH
ncbi:Uncharacterised protein [Escherichia coli]|nr:Uncharacterised protein [Escherichia coli]